MRTGIEPGLLRVFRGYAVLRLLLGAIALVLQIFTPGQSISGIVATERFGGVTEGRIEVVLEDNLLVLGGAVLLMVFLALYLYSNYLQNRLGKLFIPIAILAATATLLLEQYLLTPRAIFWQTDSFFFVLLILVSWQYNMLAVVAFSSAVALADYALNLALRPTLFFLSAFAPPDASALGPAEVVIFFGRQTSRVLTFIVLGLVITSLMNAQRKQRKELAGANQALIQHASTLEQLTTSRERNRLSRELHDTLAHTLSGLTVQLEALQTAWNKMPAQANVMVEKMLSATRTGLNETRRTLKNLRASPLEELGLALAVQTLAQDASVRNNFSLTMQVSEKNLELPPEVEQSFYRVAQEALENVIRHANAKSVDLTLQKQNGRLELVIKDDGTGFDSGKASENERFGLTLMKERAELIEAQFSVESRLGQGTTVRMVY